MPTELYGPDAGKASALHALFDRMAAEGRLTHHSSTSVIALRDGRLHLLGPGGAAMLAYDRLILATGASDRIAPVPGWQSAGVYTLGAAQIALKAQGVALGRRTVLVGSGPLLTLVGVQLLKAGAAVEAILDTAGWRDQAHGLGGLMARPGSRCAGSGCARASWGVATGPASCRSASRRVRKGRSRSTGAMHRDAVIAPPATHGRARLASEGRDPFGGPCRLPVRLQRALAAMAAARRSPRAGGGGAVLGR